MSSSFSSSLLTSKQIQQFIIDGYIILKPEEVKLAPSSVNKYIYDEGIKFLDDAGKGLCSIAENVNARIPRLKEVLRSEGVKGCLTSILGEGYTLHPHTFLHTTATNRDQDFHKDGILPWNGHAMRHHKPEHMLLMYFPQETTLDLGATEILPGTQYWHIGEGEHGYIMGGRNVGPGISAIKDLKKRDEKRGEVLKKVGLDQFKKPVRLVVPAGSVAITHFDVFHRGTRRSVNAPEHVTRQMFKFWYTRATRPSHPTWNFVPADDDMDPDLFKSSYYLKDVYRSMWFYMCGKHDFQFSKTLSSTKYIDGNSESSLNENVDAIIKRMVSSTEQENVALAYELGMYYGDYGIKLLSTIAKKLDIHDNVTTNGVVRRTIAYGLESAESRSSNTFVEMSNMITKPDGKNGKKYKTVSSENKGNNANAQGKTIIEDFESNNQKYLRDCRVLAAYGLGRCGIKDDVKVHEALSKLLLEDPSEFVRSTAAEAIGIYCRKFQNESIPEILISSLLETLRVPSYNSKAPVHDLNEGEFAANRFVVFAMGPPIPRSGSREHGSWSLINIISSCNNIDEHLPLKSEIVQVVDELAYVDRNRYAHGFSQVALGRMARKGYGPASDSLNLFLKPNGPGSMRWKSPEFQMNFNVDQSYYDGETKMYVSGIMKGARL